MNILKFIIHLDPSLVDSLSDFLIGVHDAAIEFAPDGDGPCILQAFVEKELRSLDDVESMVEQVRAYGVDLARIFSCDAPEVRVEFLEDQDWSETWKAHFKPFSIVPGLVIAPTWEQYEPAPGEKIIVMDPGLAFGTGHHETTRLCLKMLSQAEAITNGGTMLDVGTGTGILAMAAVLFGASHAVGIDNDPQALKAARANCRLNGLAEQIEINGRGLRDIKPSFDLVVANIVYDVLLELSEDLGRVAAGGALLLSGLIEGSQSVNTTDCFAKMGFRLVDMHTDGQWSALLMHQSAQ